MSLINDALKKAQRLRSDSPTDLSPIPGETGSGHIAKRGRARSANTVVLIGAGALVLVVLSVVATIYLVNRPAPAAPQPSVAAATPNPAAPAVSAPAASPIVGPTSTASVAEPAQPATSTVLAQPPPAPATAKPETPPAASPAAVANSTPGGTPATRAAPSTKSAGATASPAAPAPTAPAAAEPASAATKAPVPDPRIAAFVEAVRVAGIRSSGDDSRVLMNDRVYKVNDIVERTLGIRLVKVGTDGLTFADANGATYVKYF